MPGEPTPNGRSAWQMRGVPMPDDKPVGKSADADRRLRRLDVIGPHAGRIQLGRVVGEGVPAHTDGPAFWAGPRGGGRVGVPPAGALVEGDGEG